MPVVTGHSTDHTLATEEADIAEIVQGFLTPAGAGGRAGRAASPCDPRQRRVCESDI